MAFQIVVTDTLTDAMSQAGGEMIREPGGCRVSGASCLLVVFFPNRRSGV